MKAAYEGGAWHGALTGDIDLFNAPDVKKELTALVQERPGSLCLDCAGLNYLDSTGLGMLVGVYKRMREVQPDAAMTLTGLKPHLLKIFILTGLDKLFALEVCQ